MLLGLFLSTFCFASNYASNVDIIWDGQTVRDLHQEYNNIFKFGNRNAASHLWSTFLFDRSAHMTTSRLETMFSGYCAISGSPVHPNDYKRYRLSLDTVWGSTRDGFMYYCCWPCVCDTQDFIKVDTKNVTTVEGTRQYHFAVIGNPCDNPAELTKPFVQPFGQRHTTIAQDAREVRCNGGELLGATLSDHGYIIIGMFFDTGVDGDTSNTVMNADQTPGRMSEVAGVKFQDEHEFADMCTDRANKGYNSGMGEIFRKVAAISPILPDSTCTAQST